MRLTPYRAAAARATASRPRSSGKLGPIAKVGPSNDGPTRISRAAYAGMFGPTTGDRVRLADTDLFIEVEKDHTIYGEEVKFGGGKVIRDGMGQSQRTRARGRGRHRHHQRADPRSLGHREGRHRPQGRPHRRHRQGRQSRHPARRRPSSSARAPRSIAGEGKIVTAGGIDSHIHFICPQQIDEALYSGVTTMIGGGTGPAHGTLATTCTPGPWHIGRMLQAAEGLPMNLGFFGKGNASQPAGARGADRGRRLRPEAARGLGHHAGRDRQLPRPSPTAFDVQVAIHTDTLNEVGLRRDHASPPSRAAPSTPSTPRAPAAAMRPTSSGCAARRTCCRPRPIRRMPYTVNTMDEHLDMLMVCHHLDRAHSRGRGLRREPHPQGDHRRRGHPARPRRLLDDVVRQPGDGPRRRGRDPHLADRRQDEEAARPAEGGDRATTTMSAPSATSPNTRSIPPSRTASRDHVGSVEVGKLRRPGALVAGLLRRQARHGAESAASIAAAPMGDPNASIPTPQPVHYRPMFGAFGRSLVGEPGDSSSSQAGHREGRRPRSWGLTRPLLAVEGHAQDRQEGHGAQRRSAPRSRSIPRPTRCAPTASC